MSHRRKLAAALATVAIAVTLARPWSRETLVGFVRGEPFADYRPAGAWISELRDGGDKHYEARQALTRLGGRALKQLTAGLSDRAPYIRSECAKLLGELGPIAEPALAGRAADPDPKVRAEIAVARSKATRQLAPLLASLLGDESAIVRFRAATALQWTDLREPSAIPALTTALADHDVETREQAALALACYGPSGAAAVPVLVGALKDMRDPDLAGSFVEGLGQIGVTTSDVLEALVGALRGPKPKKGVPNSPADIIPNPYIDSKPKGADGAIKLLAKAGQPAVPLLLRTLSDPDRWTCFGVAKALSLMGPVAVPHLIDALGRSEFDRTGVTYVLANMGPGAALAVTALTHALKDPLPDLRTLAAWALGEVGREASPAVPVLRQLAVDDPSSSARRRCGWAVWRVTGDAVLVLTELGKMIHRPQSFRPSDIVRDSDEEDAINLLREIGRPALPLLTEAVRDPARRGLVVEILTPPDSWGRDAVELLVECARRKDGDGFELFREQALDLLGELGPEAAPAVPFLVELAQPANSDSHLRLPAIRALARLGPDCVSAVRPLSNLLTDPNPEVRREAADALRRYGPAASEIVPALVRALRVAPDYEQRQYREALDATGIGEVRILIWFVIIGLADNSLWVGVVGSFAVVLMAGRAWYRWCDQLRYPPTSKYFRRP